MNFPDCDPSEVKDTVLTRQGRRDQAQLSVEPRKDTRGQSYFWLGFEGRKFEPQEGTDLYAIYHKQISVTPLHLDMTDHNTLKMLSGL